MYDGTVFNDRFSKCCVVCGRWGTQAFRQADTSDGHGEDWICTSDRACRRRASWLSQDAAGGAS